MPKTLLSAGKFLQGFFLRLRLAFYVGFRICKFHRLCDTEMSWNPVGASPVKPSVQDGDGPTQLGSANGLVWICFSNCNSL